MSGISISPYFPFRRIKITKQAVDAAAAKAVIDVIPDQRFVPVCQLVREESSQRPQLGAAAAKGFEPSGHLDLAAVPVPQTALRPLPTNPY